MDNQDDYMEPSYTPSAEVQQEMLRAQTQNFNRVAQQINNYASTLRRVPEPYFYMVLFPIIRDHFTGKQTDRIREWLNIADGMSKEIIVYDDLTNEELFIVPPFNHRTQPVRLDRQDGHKVISPNDMVELQEIYRRNGEHRKYLEIEQSLPEVYPLDGAELQERWVRNLIAIWNRYDIPLDELFGDRVDQVLQTLSEEPENSGSNDTNVVDDTNESSDIADYDF